MNARAVQFDPSCARFGASRTQKRVEDDRLLTGSMMDYCLPRADQFPPMATHFDESVPCRTNHLGVKGCGEIGTIGAVPAVVHAVLDALSAYGVAHVEMPVTAEKVWCIVSG